MSEFSELPPDSVLSRCAPIGVEIDDGVGMVLCSGTTGSRPWFVSIHEDWNSLQDEIDALIRSAYQPLDLSRDAGALVLLWVESTETAPDWRLSSCEATIPVPTRAIHEYGHRGYQLAGLSAHDGLFWLLFSRTPPGATLGLDDLGPGNERRLTPSPGFAYFTNTTFTVEPLKYRLTGISPRVTRRLVTS